MLDSLIPDTDKIPETVRITFLQMAVQQNPDLRQIHVLDSVWRSKTGSTGKFTFEAYYDLLWNAAYQHDLNKATKQHRERPSFPIKMIHMMNLNMILRKKILQLIKIKMNLPHTQSFNPPSILLHLKNLPEFLFPIISGESCLKLQKWMVIECNKKIKVVSPKPHLNGGKSKPNPTLGKPNSNPQ